MQNIGWYDAALRVWNNKKHELQNELRAIGSLIFAYVDTRYDSNRFAYHDTTLVMSPEHSKILFRTKITVRK